MTTSTQTGADATNTPGDVVTLPPLRDVARALRARLRRRWTGADSAAAAVVVLHLGAVLALVVPGWLFVDDLRAQAYAAGRPVLPFVVESNNTHLAPGARTVDWLMTTYAPLQHWPAVALTVVIHLALGAATWWLLRELVGPRPVAVVLLALALLNPCLVPSTAWFRQALTTQLGLTCVLVALATTVRTTRRGGPLLRPALVVGAATAVGVTFSERAIAAVPLCLAAATLLVPDGARPRDGGSDLRAALATAPSALRRRIRRAVLLCLPAAVAVGGFLLAYSAGEYDRGAGSAADPTALPRVAALSLGLAVLPALLGGPWRWETVLSSYGLADPPAVLLVLTGVAAAAAAWWTLRPGRRGRALRAAAVFLAYAAPVWGMIWLGRLPGGNLAAVRDLRLWPDLSVLLVCLAAPVVAGLRGSPAGTAPQRRPWSRGLVAVAATAALALVAGSAVSWVSFGREWSTTRTEAYVERLRDDLATVQGSVLPSPVPDHVVPGWVQSDLTSLDLVRALDPSRADVVTDSAPLAVDAGGRLGPAELRTVARALPAPAPGFCGRFAPAGATGWVDVPFAGPVPYLRAMVVRVGVLVEDRTALELRVDDGTSAPDRVRTRSLPRGPHVLTVPVRAGSRPQAVQVRSVARVATCVPDVSVALAGPS